MKLKDVDTLRHVGRSRACQQLIAGSRESHKSRRIGTEAEIDAYRPHRGAIPDPETDAMNTIIEILVVHLTESKTDVLDIGIDVAHVMEQDSAEIVADQRKSQLEGVQQVGAAAQREPRFQVARAGLVFGKRPMRRCAARIKAFREGYLRQPSEPLNVAKGSSTG